MRVQLKESIRMTNLILSRRGFLAGLSSLLAAPAVVRAEALMPIKVWRPPLIWRDGLIAANGVELAIADFPDLFTIFGYMHGGGGPKFRLYDYTPSNSMWYIAPRVTDDEWPFMRQAYCMPPQSPDLQEMYAKRGTFTETETFPKYKTISDEFRARLEATRAEYAR
jgi:Phage Tail Collar Domain